MNLHSIGVRVIGSSMIFLLILVAGSFYAYAVKQRANWMDAETQAARRLLMVSESARNNMAEKWEKGLFSVDMLREFSRIPDKSERESKILAAVPVVAAWQIIREKAAEGGFELRTPRVGARNKQNEPDGVEREALAYFEANPEATEYVVMDDERNAVRYFRPVHLGRECLVCHGDASTSMQLWGRSDGRDILGFPMDNKKVGDLHGAFEIISSMDETDALINRDLRYAGLFAVLGLLLIAGILFLVVNRVMVRPLAQLGLALEDIASGDGDLSARLKVEGKTEVAWVSASFNRFVGKIQRLIIEVGESTRHLFDASQQLQVVVEETETGVRRQNEETELVATAMNEMSATVHEVAKSAMKASEAATDTEREANAGKQVVADAVRGINQLADDVDKVAVVIKELEEDSDNIGNVLKVIQDIADQTNLLALNAAIEAARAGQQGRGFAVVADEVRTLASRTQESTKEIQETIERLQSRARKAAQAMAQGRAQTAVSVQQAGSAGAVLDSINAMLGTITDMNAQIASAAEQQSVVAEEINRNVVNISEVSKNTLEGAHHTSTATEGLLATANNLRKLVDQFKT